MRKTLLALLLGSTFLCIGQDDSPTRDVVNLKHEFRIDAAEALIVPNIEINYEYVINQYSGVGAAVNFSLDEEFSEYQQFAFTPYFRQYFFNKEEFGARGLFIEGMFQFATGEEIREDVEFIGPLDDIPVVTRTENSWFETGIGFAIGLKWVSNNGFVFELSIGGGRYLLGADYAPDAFFRAGALIGYRLF